jgi:hypothetical protein
MNSSATIKELASALEKAQAEMSNPTFDSTNPHFKSKFASLAAVREAVLPVLNKHGLSVTQFPKAEDGKAGCVNRLMHRSGEWLEDECLLPLDKNNAQGAGSCITYARRYSLQGIGGVVADEDDDGHAASKGDHGTNANGTKKAFATPHKPTDGAKERVDPKRHNVIADVATLMKDHLDAGRDWDAYANSTSVTDADELVYLWTFFDAPQRKRLKEQDHIATQKQTEKA